MPSQKHSHRPAIPAVLTSLLSVRYAHETSTTQREPIAPSAQAWIKSNSGSVSDVIRHTQSRSDSLFRFRAGLTGDASNNTCICRASYLTTHRYIYQCRPVHGYAGGCMGSMMWFLNRVPAGVPCSAAESYSSCLTGFSPVTACPDQACLSTVRYRSGRPVALPVQSFRDQPDLAIVLRSSSSK
jgi:hypothetical protein